MQYHAAIPIASYLEQYVRYRSGVLQLDCEGVTALNLQAFPIAARKLDMCLRGFGSKDEAMSHWPDSVGGVRVVTPELNRRSKRDMYAFYLLGPSGREAVVQALVDYFDCDLMTGWLQELADAQRASSDGSMVYMPEKARYIQSFLEANGVEYSDKEYNAVRMRFARMIDRQKDTRQG